MTVKMVWRWNWQTTPGIDPGVAGASEEWYFDQSSINSGPVLSIAQTYGRNRAAALTIAANIVDCRVTVPGQAGSRLIDLGYPGALFSRVGTGDGPELVNVCANSTIRSTSGSRRTFQLRGLPDGDVTNSRFTAALNGRAAYDKFMGSLTSIGGYPARMKVQTLGAMQMHAGITSNQIAVPTGRVFTVGGLYKVKAQIVGNGCNIHKIVKFLGVASSGDGTDLILMKGWDQGNAMPGSYKSVSYTYETVVSALLPKDRLVRTRKTGRPSGLLSGKASPRC